MSFPWERTREGHWEFYKPPLSTFPRPRNMKLKGFIALTQCFCITQFLRNFSSTNLSNISLNPWTFWRSSSGKESDNLNLCCVKEQLSPSSAFCCCSLLLHWFFVCPSACFQKPGTCRSLLVQCLPHKEKTAVPRTPSFHWDITALFTLLPLRHHSSS